MTLSVHHYRRPGGRGRRYPPAGQPLLAPAVAHRLMLELKGRFPESKCIACSLHPARTYDASEVAQIANTQTP